MIETNIVARISTAAVKIGGTEHLPVRNYNVKYVPSFKEPKLRVAAVQIAEIQKRLIFEEDIEAHALHTIELIRKLNGLNEYRPDLVILPELGALGCLEIKLFGVCYSAGTISRFYKDIASETGIYTGFGSKSHSTIFYRFAAPADHPFEGDRAAVTFNKLTEKGLYAYPKERLITINGLKIGTLICCEACNQSLIDSLVKENPDLVLVPAFAERKYASKFYTALKNSGFTGAFICVNFYFESEHYKDYFGGCTTFYPAGTPAGFQSELSTIDKGPGILLVDI